MGVSWARTCLIAAGNMLAGTTISIVQAEARTALAAQTGSCPTSDSTVLIVGQYYAFFSPANILVAFSRVVVLAPRRTISWMACSESRDFMLTPFMASCSSSTV